MYTQFCCSYILKSNIVKGKLGLPSPLQPSPEAVQNTSLRKNGGRLG